MNRSEIIFLIIVVIAYIICSFALNLPMHMQIIGIGLLILVILALLLTKFKQKFENEKISNVALQLGKILSLILVLAIIYGFVFRNPPFDLYPILAVLAFICLFVGWFFKKEN